MAENKKTSKELLNLAAGIGGAAYTAKAIPMRRVADYMHNYLDGYYGPGVTNWQKTQLMGREAAKASRRFAYNSLLDPVEVLAYDKTGIPPQLHRRYLAAEKEIARITPDIDMKQEVEMGGETVEVNIPLTVEFFWPKTTG